MKADVLVVGFAVTSAVPGTMLVSAAALIGNCECLQGDDED